MVNVGAGQSPQKSSFDKTTRSLDKEGGQSPYWQDVAARSDRRKIVDKIELLYHAKSLERKEGSRQGYNSKVPFLTPGRNNAGAAPADSELGRYFKRRSSKVVAMTKLFDNGSAPKPLAAVAPDSPRKPVFLTSSPFADQKALPKLGGARSLPTPPPIPRSTVKRKSMVSPKTLPEAPTAQLKNKSLPKAMNNTAQPQRSLQKKPSKPKGRSINEKVQLFEGVRDGEETISLRKRNVFARKLSRSLKSLFDPALSKKGEVEMQPGQGRGLSGREVQAIVDKAHDGNKSVKIRKRGSTLVGRWNAMPAAPIIRNACDGAFSEPGIGSPSAAEVREMVVKEAECGLKEPKPVRVVEVKRMLLICKERFEDMRDKEKVQTRKH